MQLSNPKITLSRNSAKSIARSSERSGLQQNYMSSARNMKSQKSLVSNSTVRMQSELSGTLLSSNVESKKVEKQSTAKVDLKMTLSNSHKKHHLPPKMPGTVKKKSKLQQFNNMTRETPKKKARKQSVDASQPSLQAVTEHKETLNNHERPSRSHLRVQTMTDLPFSSGGIINLNLSPTLNK